MPPMTTTVVAVNIKVCLNCLMLRLMFLHSRNKNKRASNDGQLLNENPGILQADKHK